MNGNWLILLPLRMRTQAWEVYGLMAEEKDLKEQKA